MKKVFLIILAVVTFSLCMFPATGINADAPETVSGTFFDPYDISNDIYRTVGSDNVITEFAISTQGFGWTGDIKGNSIVYIAAIFHTYNVSPNIARVTAKMRFEFEGTINGDYGTAIFEGVVISEIKDSNMGTFQGTMKMAGTGDALTGLSGVLTLFDDNLFDDTLYYEGKIHLVD